MAQEYVVLNARISKDKNGNPKTYTNDYGTMVTWDVYFEGDETRWQWTRKEGSDVNAGDIVYGNAEVVERSGYKFPTFKSEKKPLGFVSTIKKSDTLTLTDEKLDYIIELLESITGRKEISKDVVLEDIEEGPIDLSDIPF